jgi:hypothetical protein
MEKADIQKISAFFVMNILIFFLTFATYFILCCHWINKFLNYYFMKKLLLVFVLLTFLSTSYANEVLLSDAQMIAKKAYYHRLNKYYHTVPFENVLINDVFTIQNENQNMYFVFNFKDFGFMIISAEDKMVPVLAYTFDNQYDPNHIPPNFESWMNNRVENIRFLRNLNSKTEQYVVQAWNKLKQIDISSPISKVSKGVEPLLQSVWDQGYPYNYDCPYGTGGPGGRVWAGCVATAYGQVMNYWRWPLTGAGNHCYIPEGYDEQCADFENTTYEWDEMLDQLSSKIGNIEIAKLLYHAGIAVNMMYSPNGSGAWSHDVVTAMKEYFRYSNTTELIYRDSYSNDEWTTILKNQLDNGYPMYYAGCEGKGCHAFVLDGYTEDEEYHFNLGWGGAANGYYSIENPGGFPSWQQVIINSYPNEDYPPYCSGIKTLTALSGIITDGSGPLQNYLNNANAGWLIEQEDELQNVTTITLTFLEMNIASGDFIKIYDGNSTDAPLMGSFNSTNYPESIESTGEAILIMFESDANNTDQGFKIKYQVNEVETPGIDMILTEYSGTITDESGEYNYQNSQTSLWTVDLPDAEKIFFDITEFHTQGIFDYLRFIDAETLDYIATVSGNFDTISPPSQITIPSGKAWLLFKTDVLHTAPGWSLNYSSQLVGTDELSQLDKSIHIFPNPASSILKIQLKNEQAANLKIEILNAQSQLCHQDAITRFYGNYQNSIDISEYPDGVYYVKITSGDEIRFRKFIKI